MTHTLMTMSAPEWDCFLAGVLHGYAQGESAGHARGHHDANAEMAAIQREAARIVHTLASLEPIPPATRDRRCPEPDTAGPIRTKHPPEVQDFVKDLRNPSPF